MTNNDNLDALRFYQRRGFQICAIHIDSVKDPLIKEARALNKPSVDCHEFLLEGKDIINWAISAGIQIKHVFSCDKSATNDW